MPLDRLRPGFLSSPGTRFGQAQGSPTYPDWKRSSSGEDLADSQEAPEIATLAVPPPRSLFVSARH